MSFYRAPVKVIKEIIQIQNRFLWCGREDKRCVSWVSWNNTCKPKEEGALGVKHIGIFNRALLCKWKWRILTEDGTLWKRMLVNRYGDVYSAVLLGYESKASTWWKDIIHISRDKTNLFDCFAGGLNGSLGNDNRILFWFSRWLGGSPLKDNFPVIFSLSKAPVGKVNEMGRWRADSWEWDFKTEVDDVLNNPVAAIEALELMELLTDHKPLVDGVDTFKWWPSHDGLFSVKSCYNVLRDKQQEEMLDVNSIRMLKQLWSSKVPSKLKVFGFRFVLNRLPTKDQLAKRNIIHSDSDKVCHLCGIVEEKRDHLFFSCNIAKILWQCIYMWLDVKMLDNLQGIDHFFAFCKALEGRITCKQRSMLWLAVVWSVWIARNNSIFNSVVAALDDIVGNIKLLSWSWLPIGKKGVKCPLWYNWFHAPIDCFYSA